MAANATDILIVGAGTSGLALAYELERRGASVRVVDAGSCPGERWCKRHPQLRLNTHKWLSHLPGKRFDKSAGAFPSRDEFVQYIEDYARALKTPVDYGVRIDRVRKDDENWLAESEGHAIRTRDIVIATGPDHVPFTPDWPGRQEFTGAFIHAAAFPGAGHCDGKSVLLIGAGNSSVDIANHLAKVETKAVWISARGGSTVVPQYLFGVPTHLLTPALRPLPASAVDVVASTLSRLFCGDLEKRSMPPPPMGALSRMLHDGAAPGIDNGFSKALRAGKVEIVPAIEHFARDKVMLKDGRALSPDIVICGTGYRTGLEAMLGGLDVLDGEGAPRYSGDAASPDHPGLWFFGFRNSFWGNLNERRREAPRLAELILRRRG